MMETEVPNRAYALFLEDTRRQKGDHELLKEIQRRDSDSNRVWTTLDVPYDVDNPFLLWNGNVPPPDRENFPVALVTHVDAMDFCRWLNDRFPGPGVFWLPTREQWCAAAYGGNSRAFPWGDEWNPAIPRVSSSRNNLLAEPVPVDSPTRDVTPQGIRHLGEGRQAACVALDRCHMGTGAQQCAGQAAGAGADFDDVLAADIAGAARDLGRQVKVEQEILPQRFLRHQPVAVDDVAQRRQVIGYGRQISCACR